MKMQGIEDNSCNADWTVIDSEELKRLKQAEARYEYIRKLHPRAYRQLWDAALQGFTTFDEIVDREIGRNLTCKF